MGDDFDLLQSVRIQQNLRSVLERIEQAALQVSRRPVDIRLVIVTKLQPVGVIRAAYESGGRIFGENYAEEALPKMEALADSTGIEWHMIGHVQGRKARMVVDQFSLVHSLDSLKLALRYEALLVSTGRVLPTLLEFNLGGEDSKSGWLVRDENQWEQLLPEIEKILALEHIQVCGLMTMPPLFVNPELARPYFQRLQRLRDFLAGKFPAVDWSELSMGTSSDYEIAIQEGATLVRIGQAILGPRLAR